MLLYFVCMSYVATRHLFFRLPSAFVPQQIPCFNSSRWTFLTHLLDLKRNCSTKQSCTATLQKIFPCIEHRSKGQGGKGYTISPKLSVTGWHAKRIIACYVLAPSKSCHLFVCGFFWGIYCVHSLQFAHLLKWYGLLPPRVPPWIREGQCNP